MAQTSRMKCPLCVEASERSTLRVSALPVTAMGWDPYYDEDGNFHSHDPNRHAVLYVCSRGHEFTRGWLVACGSCDYGQGSESVKALEVRA